jgi:hypothetical protein
MEHFNFIKLHYWILTSNIVDPQIIYLIIALMILLKIKGQ